MPKTTMPFVMPPNMEKAYQEQSKKTPMSREVWALAQFSVKLTGEDQREAKEALYDYGYLCVRLNGKLCLISNKNVPQNPYEK